MGQKTVTKVVATYTFQGEPLVTGEYVYRGWKIQDHQRMLGEPCTPEFTLIAPKDVFSTDTDKLNTIDDAHDWIDMEIATA